MRSTIVLLAAAVAVVAAAACAQGSQIDPGAGGFGAGGAGAGAGGGVTSSSSSSSSGASSSSSSSSSSASSSSSSTSSSSGGPTCDFSAPAGCQNATPLPSVDGDQGNDTRTASGDTSKWFTVEVMEAVSSLISYPQLSYTVTLVSPPGTLYGLFVYPGTGSGPTCFAQVKQGSGNPATVSDTWSDTPVIDDSKWITVEVRWLSGDACGPSDLWHLTVAGHTNP